LPEAFGCQGWLSEKVATVQELEAVLERIERHDGAAYIEVMIPNEESQPLPAATIDQSYKLKTPAVE
jgi:indolepyruvate decarboxylase